MTRLTAWILVFLVANTASAQDSDNNPTLPSYTFEVAKDKKSVDVRGFAATNEQVEICVTQAPPQGMCAAPITVDPDATDKSFSKDGIRLPSPSPDLTGYYLSIGQGTILWPTVYQIPVGAANSKLCSTEIVNSDCTIRFDRQYPVTLPTIQMKTGAKVTVVVDNQLPFEMLTLDPQTAQAIAGTDQTSGFLTAVNPNLKNILTSISQNPAAKFFVLPQVADLATVPPDSIDHELQVLTDKLNVLRTKLDSSLADVHDLSGDVQEVYLQLQEVSAPLPRPIDRHDSPGRPAFTQSAPPDPWTAYQGWRTLLLEELTGCTGADPNCDSIAIRDVLTRAADLKRDWTPTAPPVDAGEQKPDCTADPDDCPYPPFKDFDKKDFEAQAQDLKTRISQEPSTADRDRHNKALTAIVDRESQLFSVIQSSGAIISATVDAITKDLNQYAANIYMASGIGPHALLGSIYDPIFSPYPAQSVRHPDKRKLGPGYWGLMKFGRQAVFALNAVNLVDTSSAVVPTSSQKKAIATITVVYADPIFEVSAGTFLSWLPNRSFANVTQVVQDTSCPTTGTTPTPTSPPTPPVACNVVITETDKSPTVVPFVAANWRLGPDFKWIDSRRGAVYFTTAVGIDPNTTTTEYAGGFSLSWRALMVSPVYHIGRDIHLTQGEYVGEIWCNQSGAVMMTGGIAIPKCSGSPPSPTTKQVWKGAFALGISVRVPSVFGGGAASGGSKGGN